MRSSLVQHRINRRHPVYKENGAVYIVGVAKICDLILKALLGNYLGHCRLGDMGRRVSPLDDDRILNPWSSSQERGPRLTRLRTPRRRAGTPPCPGPRCRSLGLESIKRPSPTRSSRMASMSVSVRCATGFQSAVCPSPSAPRPRPGSSTRGLHRSRYSLRVGRRPSAVVRRRGRASRCRRPPDPSRPLRSSSIFSAIKPFLARASSCRGKIILIYGVIFVIKGKLLYVLKYLARSI
jgi:hypothetical protein